MTRTTRRDFLVHGATMAIGSRLLAAMQPMGHWPSRNEPRADAVIQIHMSGGLSHIDTFDPKPEAAIEVRGPFGAIESKLAGCRFTSLLPKTASIADKLVVVRSMTHTEADHDRGAHSVLTGYAPSPAIVYPSFGSVVAHELGMRNDLPPYVCVPGPNSPFLQNGYLGSAHAPFAVGGNPGSARFRVRDLSSAQEMDEARRNRRKSLLHDLDARRPELQTADAVVASEAFYEQAFTMLESEKARAAFDLQKEPDAKKDRYGRHRLGMSALLARRLVAAGSRYVVIAHDGFDHHARLGNDLPSRMAEFDQTFSALVADLDAEGLLDRTLVIATSEFGRTPRINADGGRDHWARAFSIAMAGGGCKRGVVLGATNATGAEPESDPVRPADLAATVFSLLGIDPAKKLMSSGDRPIDLVRDGAPIRGAIA